MKRRISCALVRFTVVHYSPFKSSSFTSCANRARKRTRTPAKRMPLQRRVARGGDFRASYDGRRCAFLFLVFSASCSYGRAEFARFGHQLFRGRFLLVSRFARFPPAKLCLTSFAKIGSYIDMRLTLNQTEPFLSNQRSRTFSRELDFAQRREPSKDCLWATCPMTPRVKRLRSNSQKRANSSQSSCTQSDEGTSRVT